MPDSPFIYPALTHRLLELGKGQGGVQSARDDEGTVKQKLQKKTASDGLFFRNQFIVTRILRALRILSNGGTPIIPVVESFCL